MLENLLSKIENDGSAELFFLLAGSLLLYAAQRLYAYCKRAISRMRLKRAIKAYTARKEGINVLDIANGDPEYTKENIFLREASNLGRPKGLFISFPEKQLEELRKREAEAGYSGIQRAQFRPDESFNGTSDFSELAEITGIEDLVERINKNKAAVANDFISKSSGFHFNGEKYGIFDFRQTRFGEDEEPGVEINLFRTDYFTHRVFRSIYRDLKAEGHEISKVRYWDDDFLKYRPFLTSFGINAVLICEGIKGREIVLSKRSTKVSGENSLYHVTMNEGLSQTDKDAFGRVDLELCFKRGLLEELGIDDDLYHLALRTAFYDFFLDKRNLEIGLSAVFEIDVNFTTEIEPLTGRDKNYESAGFQTIPLHTKQIARFVSAHDFVPHGLYVLERVLMRNGISIARLGTPAVGAMEND